MHEPKSLDNLFKLKIFRVPDYQRGYAWRREQLKDFWEDLINLPAGRSHYTGVLTLKQLSAADVRVTDKEFWLVDDHSYHVYHVVDGQQRLTTFIIFIQAFVEVMKSLPENHGKMDIDIYLTGSLSLAALQDQFLFKTKPTGDKFRTYKFGYETDNPSYTYLRHRILAEEGGGSTEETYYTLNLSNAKAYFTEQLRSLHAQAGMAELQEVYKKLTKGLLFNEYIIKDDLDVFVAFETMNNRGKRLSDLELLKNRLIYLTTLYDDSNMDAADRKSLRDTINDAWKEVYHQLGRNKARPLNDDDFLRAHWTMYFKYSRNTGRDYIRFLLDEQFTPKRILRRTSPEVAFEILEEVQAEEDAENTEGDDRDRTEGGLPYLTPAEIRDFVVSLRESAVYWFNSHYPEMVLGMPGTERCRIDRLNRIGIGFFRPLVMATLKNEQNPIWRCLLWQRIERFIFIAFRMNSAMANYGSSVFYNAARALDRRETTIENIVGQLDDRLAYTFYDDGTFRSADFSNILEKKFTSGSGYYGWTGLRYFLFEYEVSLLSESRQQKVGWNDLLKSEHDKVSIEHIYPQTESDAWTAAFQGLTEPQRKAYGGTLGNLLLLSMSINSTLQNDSFDAKKRPQISAAGVKQRNGYADGSHSEIEVSACDSWGPEQIKARGTKLLEFLEKRWDVRFRNTEERERLLFLNSASSVQ